MPQVDLASVCAGATHDRKVACETLAVGGVGEDTLTAADEEENPPIPPPDYAPESFWLSKDAELDWFDRNAFLDRKDSGKGVNSTTSSNPVHITAGSQRYSGNLSKASLIALPKPQKQNYAEVKNRRHHCRPTSVRLFPKRADPVGKPVIALTEPGSPKVSCMGRVRSRKDRSRRGKNRKKVNEPGLGRNKSIKERNNKTGFWKNFRSIFRHKGNNNNKLGCIDIDADQQQEGNFVRRSSSSKKKRGFNPNDSVGSGEPSGLCEPPGLGAMKRFASGRKSDSWAGDVEIDGTKSEPLGRGGGGGGGPIWRRREVGPPIDVDIDRDWREVGPMSV
ncbi:hypothetical protein SOVF_077710 [Spinacia oleracea]|uniref:Uncharacterized protein n=1 Tax=Spinacia oleracea TaxID=3562 RepID=A0A9R0HU53_SPIOL|nr:uncharacterized protein LOC110776854 [Spinacia oleracea]KNA17680.1 hypothetical protein SOVF_077710 [Spinacia oleracea]